MYVFVKKKEKYPFFLAEKSALCGTMKTPFCFKQPMFLKIEISSQVKSRNFIEHKHTVFLIQINKATIIRKEVLRKSDLLPTKICF